MKLLNSLPFLIHTEKYHSVLPSKAAKSFSLRQLKLRTLSICIPHTLCYNILKKKEKKANASYSLAAI